MKRNHNYSSSESDLDDNIEVEKDSGDENWYVSCKNLYFIANVSQVLCFFLELLFCSFSFSIFFSNIFSSIKEILLCFYFQVEPKLLFL